MINKYNVLVVVVESLRPDQLKSFGGKREVMPTVDSICKNAFIFTNIFTQASNSSYADPCIFSSNYPLRSSMYYFYPKNILYPRVFIYDVLGALKYKTAIISSQNERWGGMNNYLDTGTLSKFFHAGNYKGKTYTTHRVPLSVQGKIDDFYTVNEAVDWIKSLDNSENFFIYLNLQNSHVPYRVPESFSKRFSPKKLGFTIGFNNFPKDKKGIVKDVYADSLAYIDSQLKRLFFYLEDSELLDETIVVITGDTGQAFYEHDFAAHGNKLYDEALRVPLIIKVPHVKESRVYSKIGQHIDIPPTISGLLNIPMHPSFQGRNLLSKEDNKDHAVYSIVQAYVHQYAIIKNNWKLIFDSGEGQLFLYDLKQDPGETINLAQDNKEKVDNLFSQLSIWIKEQLSYYKDSNKYLNFYPPYFKD